ncbi:hypothetical protein Ddye_016563 [Dipteronia dyeriana]|uniref:Ubiquitin-like protease family profile domain-containing protein n=1 Tax=Dipteronia dyeriana TaxID=168575 RepID=A0AAD9U7F9_9ROSI|nr:hypothetical protein Ddye_016563 [Dipteronia dyeriana]
MKRPPKLTIKVTIDRKRSTYIDIDPTAKRPKKLKMPNFGRDSLLDEDVARLMNSWINDNKNTCMYAKPHWFEILISEIGWLDGAILFPTKVNENHWVAIVIDLKERVIKVYDSFPSINSVMEITESISCLRMMLSSLLMHTMPDIYTNASPFVVRRHEKDIPNQENRFTTNELL